MENRSNKLLKVTGIIMIVGGALGIILSIIAIVSVGVVAAAYGGHVKLGLLIFALILAIGGSAVQLVAGIFGVKYETVPEKANTCIFLAVVVVGLSFLGAILTKIAGGSFSFFSFLLGLILPGLYIYGALQNRKLTEK